MLPFTSQCKWMQQGHSTLALPLPLQVAVLPFLRAFYALKGLNSQQLGIIGARSITPYPDY